MHRKERKFRRIIRETVRKVLKEGKDDKTLKLKNGEFVIERYMDPDDVENKLRNNFAKIYFLSSDPGSIEINPWVAKVINNSLHVFDFSHVGNYTKEIDDYHTDEPLIEIESNRDGSLIFRTVSNKGKNEPGSIRIERKEIDHFLKTLSNFLNIPERISFDLPPSEDDDEDEDDSLGGDSPFGDDPLDSLNFN